MKTLRQDSKAARTARFYSAMGDMGFTFDEAETLRRAQMTLHTWAERECNGEIERDEETGKVHAFNSYTGKRSRRPIPDRETGALKRIAAVADARNERIFGLVGDDNKLVPQGDLIPYHQTDPRGCALYLVKTSDVPEGEGIGSYYNRGFAVCI